MKKYKNILLPILTFPTALLLGYILFIITGFDLNITFTPTILILNNMILLNSINKE